MSPTAFQDFFDALSNALPHLAPRTRSGGLFLVLLAILLWNSGSVMGSLRAQLEPKGLLPKALTIAQGAARLLAAYALFSATAGLFPVVAAWVVPLATVGAALALGFVITQDMAPDFSAGLLLTIQQRVRPGQWVQGDGFMGTVESLGFTALWLQDPQGRRLTVPNRTLLRTIARTDPSPHPLVQVALRVPSVHAPSKVRDAIHQVVLCSPWLAPLPQIEIQNDPMDDQQWNVRARVLQIDHQERFAQAITDAVHQLHKHLSTE